MLSYLHTNNANKGGNISVGVVFVNDTEKSERSLYADLSIWRLENVKNCMFAFYEKKAYKFSVVTWRTSSELCQERIEATTKKFRDVYIWWM